MSETKTKNLCTVPAADLTDSQYFIAEDGGELKRIPKAQVVLKKLEKMLATDTENLAGGGEVTAQELLDALAEQVANKLLAKSQVVNNLLATVEGNPLDATQGKALKDLIDTTNNNLSNKFKITADNGYTQLSQLMDVGAWSEPFVFDIPYTSSLAPASNNAVGIAERGMLHAFDYAGKHFYCIDASKGWQESPYALKSDLLNLSRTFVSGDSFSDAKDLSIPPGIYGVNPGLKNIPENTYGLLEVTADTVNNWRFLKFTPTNIKSHYLMFYNGYDKTWSEWAHFASTT